MNIIVLIAGVHDPKWPVTCADNQLPTPQDDRQIMSPFDEAALEIALRIRDKSPGTAIKVLVAGGAAGSRIARTVAAFNIANVTTIAIGTAWDQAAVARALAGLCAGSELILIGRDFGDYDDGLVPPMLAALLGADFFGRAQAVDASAVPILIREVDGFEERLLVASRTVASVTNDRRTRLRKPLMKNVMQARQAQIGTVEAPAEPTPGLELVSVTERATSRRVTTCRMIQGTVAEQAEALAALLLEASA